MSEKLIDLPKEQLVLMFEEQNERRIKAEDEVRRLQKDSEHWRKECDKLERLYHYKCFGENGELLQS